MEVVRGSETLERPPHRAVATIGNFDGLHLGHRTILDTVIERARAHDGSAVVYTFDPHPRRVVRPDTAPPLLMTLEQKCELLEEAGIDWLIVEPFCRQFARTPPDVFIREVLHERVRPRELYVGYDFHFGRDREGSMRLLGELGPRLGFSVTVIPEFKLGNTAVSATRIRSLLLDGRVEQAAELLGRSYAVRGDVVVGDQRGRHLGFPTLNLRPDNEVLPAHGVYAGWVRMLDDGDPPAGTRFAAVTNVGKRPTFKQDDPPLAESHLLEFSGDLYGRRFELSFAARLREERRFPGPDALREQIQQDIEAGRRFLAAN